MTSNVEKQALAKTKWKIQYKNHEHIGSIIVDNFPELGTLTAYRFLEWVQKNPEGVISLPTGKTPEFFIKETKRLLETWSTDNTKQELTNAGIDPAVKPQMDKLHFVQIDEFFPIDPSQVNSFYNYVNQYYIEGFGLSRDRALLINAEQMRLPGNRTPEELWDSERVNLDLRYRKPENKLQQEQKEAIHAIDQWCVEYENKIRDLGGIGFFLGGIGPDGHIGFNVLGSDFHSTTRLTEINYETMAAAATDLGGIEVSKRSLVITIGLSTITYNKNAVAIIIAAGEAKADIVANSICKPKHVKYPATALHKVANARFYLTTGAAKKLTYRALLSFKEKKEFSKADEEQTVIELCWKLKKKIDDLTESDYKADEFASHLLAKSQKSTEQLNKQVKEGLIAKIETGVKITKSVTILHTEPHHDDIMLGYLPYVVRSIREHSNTHHFVTFTSGFTAVTNMYMLELCQKMQSALENNTFSFRKHLENGYFDPDNTRYKNRDVWKYLDGVASMSEEMKEEGTLRRFFRNLIKIFNEKSADNIKDRVEELINYFETVYPGKKDLPHIQELKGMVREFESACLWGYFGWLDNSINHLRLGFYRGEIFTEEPTINRDVLPVLDLLEKTNPDIVSVAFDPEASGPDTHYKVLQAVAEALKLHKTEAKLKVLGYRNVWFKFEPWESNVFVPVSLNMLTLQHESFMNTYITQKNASFPSYEYDGPFSLLAQKIQVEQYEKLKICLGREYFYDHPSALLRATRGFVFLKEMELKEFLQYSRELKKQAENK